MCDREQKSKEKPFKMCHTIGQLKEIIKGLPDQTRLGVYIRPEETDSTVCLARYFAPDTKIESGYCHSDSEIENDERLKESGLLMFWC